MAIAMRVSLKPKRSRLLDKMSANLYPRLRQQFELMAKQLQAKVRKNLRGPILQKRTGKLIRSIAREVGGSSIDSLFCKLSSDLPQSRMLHEGYPNRPVTEKQHKNSRFYIPGVGFRRFKRDTKSVTFHPHPYLTKTIEENREMIRIRIKTAIRMAQV